MKHPTTGKFLIELYAAAITEALNRSDVTVYHDPTGKSNGNFVSSEDARKLSVYCGRYTFAFNDENDPLVQVDYDKGEVLIHDRGGWSRSHRKTFADLEDLGAKWEVYIGNELPTEEYAEIAYKLHTAEHLRHHGLEYKHIYPTPSTKFLPPLPEPEIEGSIYHQEHKIMYRGKVHFTAKQMLEYGEKCVRDALGKTEEDE